MTAYAIAIPEKVEIAEADLAILRRAPLFPPMSEQDMDSLLPHFSTLEVARGQWVGNRSASENQHVYVLLHGRIGTFPAGRRTQRPFHVLGPSDVFGDLVALDPEATPQKALTLGPTRLARVPADYLVSWLTADPARARHVLRWLAGRVLLGHEAMIDQQAIDIPRRVAQAVLDMAQRFGEPDREGVLVQHELTQAQLADLIGASREAVNRALSRLTRRGWLEIEKGSVMVHDLSAMIRYVDAARTTPYRYSHAQCRTADGWCAG